MVQALSHVGEFFRHARIGALDAWRRIEQRRRGNALHVPLSKCLVPVTRKDDLALLGHLKEAVHRSRRLRQHGTVCRAAAATHSAAATVHEHKVDAVLLGPVGDALLRRVQRERRRGGTGILRGIRVAKHDLHAAIGLCQTHLDRRQLEHLIEHVDAAFKVLKLLE